MGGGGAEGAVILMVAAGARVDVAMMEVEKRVECCADDRS